MLVETGQVREVMAGRALILIKRASACQSCGARGACLTFGSNERTVEVRDPLGTSVGDRVQIGIPPAQVVWASTLVYILPVIAMIAGAMIGLSIAPEGARDETAAGCSFGALALCFLGLYIVDRLRGVREDKIPIVLRVVDESADAEVCTKA